MPRIVTTEEAKAVLGVASIWSKPIFVADLAHTVIVLGEQREAVLALHTSGWDTGADGTDRLVCTEDGDDYPCPTARALGVTA